MNLRHLSGKSFDELEDFFEDEEELNEKANRIKQEKNKQIEKYFKQEDEE